MISNNSPFFVLVLGRDLSLIGWCPKKTNPIQRTASSLSLSFYLFPLSLFLVKVCILNVYFLYIFFIPWKLYAIKIRLRNIESGQHDTCQSCPRVRLPRSSRRTCCSALMQPSSSNTHSHELSLYPFISLSFSL